MGDVFKVVFAIHDFFPQFSYATFGGAPHSSDRKSWVLRWIAAAEMG